ncbi:MAG TPA: deoxyribodipyrimidine photo-lyase [Jatrophihabitans sp.]|jgi:deoxyribodipyrimidine photo-lyase
MVSTAIVLFTRDLRIRDNPTLWRAVHAHDRVVPLFVLDDDILKGDFNRPNRATFLAESLADLDAALRGLGAGLVIRRGRLEREVADVAQETNADAVHLSLDASRYSAGRVKRLRDTIEVVGHDDTLFVVPPGRIRPSGGNDHMSVFGAYYRRWEKQDRRPVHSAPKAIDMPRMQRGKLPEPDDICKGNRSPNLAPGGETAARERLKAWLKYDAERYAEVNDELAADATSRLSPYLHFGCVSPVELVSRKGVVADFVRQVAWRDFHAQVLSARPGSTKRDYRHRGDNWRGANEDFEAWKQGRTGLPIVDAGMRQLAEEGWMHNRARLIVGHLLVKTLYIDWRLGAQHFVDLLVDGDTSNNTMNWQWVAGTGTDSRYNRTFSVDSQAKRYDPRGDYVRRYIPELRGIDGPAVHRPWTLPDDMRKALDYPDPIVDVAEGNRRFLAARGA